MMTFVSARLVDNIFGKKLKADDRTACNLGCQIFTDFRTQDRQAERERERERERITCQQPIRVDAGVKKRSLPPLNTLNTLSSFDT